MDYIIEEIEKIQGERQADERIKYVLAEMANVLNNVMINCFPAVCCDECEEGKPLVEIDLGSTDSDELRAELTALYEKNEDLEEENDNLRAVATDLSETGEPEDELEKETKSDI